MGVRARGMDIKADAMRNRVIEAHEHVGAEPSLVAHRVLRGHPQSRAVIGGDERGAVVIYCRDLDQADQLIAAAVGENRMVPPHERVQPACPLDEVDPGSQREVIRVAEQDVDTRVAYLVGVQRLHRGMGPDRHERGSADRAVSRRQRSGACVAVDGIDRECGRHCERQQSMQSPRERNRYPPLSACA